MIYHEPPTRAMRRAAAEEGSGSAPAGMTFEEMREYIKSYDAVRRRDGGTCQSCGKPHLEAPHLRLWIKDQTESLCAAHNLELLCPACCRRRARLAAASITGFDPDVVFSREDMRCVYCLEKAEQLVARVDSADRDDPDDWTCCCQTCSKRRGSMSHDKYIAQCHDKVRELWMHLREEVMRGA